MRFAVRFLGCKVSHADAMVIRDALLDAGHRESSPENADVHVVNTCALTRAAEKKSRKQAHRSARTARTFSTGCAANLTPEQFRGGVTTIAGSVDRAAEEIVQALGSGGDGACADDRARPTSRRTRAFLKVQNGCDEGCSFCIIPTTRGSAESRPLARVLADARRRLADGHPELVLTGINIGTYRDPGTGADLADLVGAAGRLSGLSRLRISSIEPATLTPRLLEVVAQTASVAPHLHIPLQSGDGGVLAAMGRHYGPADYLDACARAREAIPGLNLTTDVIAGFPGEDDGAFANTIAVIEEAGISRVHVFPYSPRPGTAAASLPGVVAPDVRRDRAAALRDLSDRLGFGHRQLRVGSHDEVLVETLHEEGARSGFGRDYSRFTLPPGAGGPGAVVPVTVAGVVGNHLLGEPVA